MKKNNIGVMVFLIILMVGCLICGTLGALENKTHFLSPKEDNKNKDNEEQTDNFQVTYRYYLENEEVDTLPPKEKLDEETVEETEIETYMYVFDRYLCNNNVTGTWDEETWTFNPVLTANATCRLYFTKNVHSITFKAVNGILPEEKEEIALTAEINKDVTVNILPKEGYEFNKVDCTNNAKGEYNIESHDLKVSGVTKDNTVCTIDFKIKGINVEVRTANGTVEQEKVTANYNDTVTFKVKPAENYVFSTVECTNDQKATYQDETLTVSDLTNDTVCTVQFKPLKYSVSLDVEGGVILASSPSPVELNEGQNASFGISPNGKYKDYTLDCGSDVNATFESNMVKVYDVKKDISCKLTLNLETEENEKANE